MAKEDEIAYIGRLGDIGKKHAMDKPWSDDGRGLYLQEMGALISLLPAPPATVLDIGAGSGWTSCFYSLSGYQVTATDIAPEMIELAQANAARYNVPLEVVVSDFESLPFENQFDVVIFYDCLHHAEDEVLALQSAFRALKPGGICVTLEPGSGHASSAVSVQAMKDLGVTERDMPPKRIITAATRVGFSSSQVFERPVQPIELSHRLLPRWKTSTRLIHRLIARSTPIVMYRGHFVVLHKPNT